MLSHSIFCVFLPFFQITITFSQQLGIHVELERCGQKYIYCLWRKGIIKVGVASSSLARKKLPVAKMKNGANSFDYLICECL